MFVVITIMHQCHNHHHHQCHTNNNDHHHHHLSWVQKQVQNLMKVAVKKTGKSNFMTITKKYEEGLTTMMIINVTIQGAGKEKTKKYLCQQSIRIYRIGSR